MVKLEVCPIINGIAKSLQTSTRKEQRSSEMLPLKNLYCKWCQIIQEHSDIPCNRHPTGWQQVTTSEFLQIWKSTCKNWYLNWNLESTNNISRHISFNIRNKDLPYLLKALYQMVDLSQDIRKLGESMVSAFHHHPFESHPPIDIEFPRLSFLIG